MMNASKTAAEKIAMTIENESGAIKIPWVAKVPMIRKSKTVDAITIRLGREDHMRLRSRTT